jgi:hypothetical protein
MATWLITLKVALLVIIAGTVALVLPQPLWPSVYSYLLLGLGTVVFVLSLVVVLRGLFKEAD